MILIDTHCHLYASEFDADREAVIQRALAAGVERFYLPAIDSGHTGGQFRLEEQYPGQCRSMAGLHPCSVKESWREELKVVEELLGRRSFAAIGEIGLDFYWDKSFTLEQYDAFETQIGWARALGLPVIIHSRESMTESIAVVKKNSGDGLSGIFHCFSGSIEQAREVVDMGFYLGIGGVVTYKKAILQDVVRTMGLDCMVLETDAPYLSPLPFRGRRNESSYLLYILEKIAEIKGVSTEEVARVTTENAERVFRGR
jgi:TatD DNase family protein